MVYIYKITNPKGVVYIGQTKDIIKRKHHYKHANCKKQHMLYNSIIKYGWDNHSFEVLTEVDSLYSDDVEIAYIEHYRSYYTDGGMNLTKGGMSREMTEAMKQHLSAAIKGGRNARAKRLYQYNLDKQLIKVWDCMKCIERDLGYGTSWLSIAAKHNKKAYGYLWSYEPL